ncbi:MAG: hypothetical protein IJ901_05055 [Bacteroidaceae bacterium]|nr:hypothetical protein [Bacteroidaceae bacterium]
MDEPTRLGVGFSYRVQVCGEPPRCMTKVLRLFLVYNYNNVRKYYINSFIMDILKILTEEEKSFLKKYNLSPTDFYYAMGESVKVYHVKAKEAGCQYVVNQCQYGHRLKDRSGHCIVCNPANIAFRNRESGGGIVYVAISGKYCKVGVTDEKRKSKKESLSDREYRLNSEGGYAGLTGWRTIMSWSVEKNVGKIEREAHRILQKYKTEKFYIYSGEVRKAQEIFVCPIQTAIDAVKKAIGIIR